MARTSAKSTTASTHTHHASTQGNTTHGNTTQRNGPTHEQIARRAYELYLARGGQHGSHEQDWHQAERELKLGR